MMTNEPDELDNFTDPDLVKKAMLENQRSDFRPKFTHVICDISSQDIEPYNAKLNNGTDVRRINLHLQNMKVLATVGGEVVDTDEYDLEVTLPRKPVDTSEIAMMTSSSMHLDPTLRSIRNWKGLKQVELLEKTLEYKSRGVIGKNEDITDVNYGKDVWGEVSRTTYYYTIVSIGGAKKEAAKSTTPGLAGVGAAMLLLAGDGLTQTEFNKAAMKDPIASKDSALMSQITDGSWVKKQLEDGMIVKDGDNLRIAAGTD